MRHDRRRFLRFGALPVGLALAVTVWTPPVLGPSSALAAPSDDGPNDPAERLRRAAIARDPRLGHTWRCLGSECPGYTYHPISGEAETDTPPLTAFEDLSEDWACPRCGAAKIEFLRQTA